MKIFRIKDVKSISLMSKHYYQLQLMEMFTLNHVGMWDLSDEGFLILLYARCAQTIHMCYFYTDGHVIFLKYAPSDCTGSQRLKYDFISGCLVCSESVQSPWGNPKLQQYTRNRAKCIQFPRSLGQWFHCLLDSEYLEACKTFKCFVRHSIIISTCYSSTVTWDTFNCCIVEQTFGTNNLLRTGLSLNTEAKN